MTDSLPAHRRKAIDDYLKLVEQHPKLFAPRPGLPLVLERDAIGVFATAEFARHGDEATAVGLAARTPWHLFVTDVVRTPDGLTTYDRLIQTSALRGRPGVAVVATFATDEGRRPGAVILVRQERHATGQSHWEIPRGFGETGMTGEELAAKELREETGYVGRAARRLATVHTNTGTTAEEVNFFHIEATGRGDSKREAEEAITECRAWPVEEIWEGVCRGEITDAFTIQGLALLREMPVVAE